MLDALLRLNDFLFGHRYLLRAVPIPIDSQRTDRLPNVPSCLDAIELARTETLEFASQQLAHILNAFHVALAVLLFEAGAVVLALRIRAVRKAVTIGSLLVLIGAGLTASVSTAKEKRG